MAPSAGWELPLEYAGARDEHLAVRHRAGLLDLSHMGQLELAGRDALAAVQRLCSRDASQLATGELHYSALTSEAGTFVDDVLVFRLGGSHFLLLVNAVNVEKDARWIAGQVEALGDVAVVNTSSRYALVSLQGPAARDVLQELTSIDLAGLPRASFAHGEVAGARATVSASGDTGGDGFEVLAPPQQVPKLWTAILGAGGDGRVVPVGTAAHATLRLEAGYRTYGAEIDETTTVLEAGLDGIVAWDKGDFIGRAALADQKVRGPARRLVGFESLDDLVPRSGDGVFIRGERAGTVTSGADAPFLGTRIGMAYVPVPAADPGTEFEIEGNGMRGRARVVPMPFYNRLKG